MDRNKIAPWRQVSDVTLILLCWLTLSPLLAVPNRHCTYLSKKTEFWLSLISPFTLGVLTYTFLFLGIPYLCANVPAFASTLDSFPELIGAFTSAGGWWQMLLVVYMLPIYCLCTLVLFIAMGVTGWDYLEASVYICEYFEPWFCIAAAIAVVSIMIIKIRRLRPGGMVIMLMLMASEFIMAGYNFFVFQTRMATYSGMSISLIFNTVVKMLVDLGENTHTNYVLANIMVYILPLVAILFIGYIGWIIYTLNKKSEP